MLKVAPCPSCGAEVDFKTSIALVGICEFCNTMALRSDLKIEDLGKIGQVQEDGTLLQIGTEGSYKGKKFEIMGRLQLKYPAGLWNEWFIHMADGSEGWIGETQGNYAINFRIGQKETLPKFSDLKPGRKVIINSAQYKVRDIQKAKCIGGQGVLPFQVKGGYSAPVVDLVGEGARFATIDYSEAPPYVFAGENLEFDDFSFSNLRDEEDLKKNLKSRSFKCPNCGGTCRVRHPESTVTVACEYCGTILESKDEKVRLLEKYKEKIKYKPFIPIGAKGKLRNVEWECIGLVRRSVLIEGTRYRWSEYLIWNAKQGFRFIHEFNGHWAFIKTCTVLPKEKGSLLRHRGKTYKVFQKSEATVDYVIGEFPWKIKRGDKAKIIDYVSPPYIISKESMSNEIVWSLGQYISGERIWKAFRRPGFPPAISGVAPAQENPWKEASRPMNLMMLAFAASVMVLFIGALTLQQNRDVHAESFQVNLKKSGKIEKDPELSRITKPFELKGRSSNVRIKFSANLSNQWAYFNCALINAETGEAHNFAKEVSYYSGTSGGESWSEGDKAGSFTLGSIPSGKWNLWMLPEGNSTTLKYRVTIYRDETPWGMILVVGTLVFAPYLIFLYCRRKFEYNRWMESDFPMRPLISSGDDDE